VGRLASGNALGCNENAVRTLLNVGHQPFAIDHVLFRPAIRSLFERIYRGGLDIAQLRVIRIDLLESMVDAHSIERAIFEAGGRGFKLLLALIRAMGFPGLARILERREAALMPPVGERRPGIATAARIVGTVMIAGRDVPTRLKSAVFGLETSRRRSAGSDNRRSTLGRPFESPGRFWPRGQNWAPRSQDFWSAFGYRPMSDASMVGLTDFCCK